MSKKLYIKRKILAIIIAILSVPIFLSCAPTEEGGFLRVLDLPAVAEIEGERYGVKFKANLSQSALDSDGLRSAKLEFTAPESLAGICVEYSCGVFGVTLDEISFSGFAAEKLGAPIMAFLSVGEVVSVEKIEDKAQTRIILCRDAAVYEYIIDSKSGLPLSVNESTADGEGIMEIRIEKYITE